MSELVATLLLPDGRKVRVGPSGRNKKFTLEELQAFVGGYIEQVRLPNGQTMYVNEDGKMHGLPYNDYASIATGHRHLVVGSALLMDGRRQS